MNECRWGRAIYRWVTWVSWTDVGGRVGLPVCVAEWI